MDLPTGQSDGGSSSVEVLSSHITIVCVKGTQTNQQRGQRGLPHHTVEVRDNLWELVFFLYVGFCLKVQASGSVPSTSTTDPAHRAFCCPSCGLIPFTH